MVAAQVVIAFSFTPGDTHGCHQRTLKGFVFMRQQNATTQPIHSTAIGRVVAEIEFRINDGALPLADIPFPVRLKWLGQRLEQSGRRALVAASTCDSDCELTAAWEIDFAGQSDVASLGFMKFPIHLKIAHQVVPAVAGADIADRPARKIRSRGHYQMNGLPLGVEEFGGTNLRTRTGITRAVAGDMRGQQCVKPQLSA